MGRLRLYKYHNVNNVENVSLNWFKKINYLLIVKKYNYNCTRVLTILKKKTANYRIAVSHLYDRIVQKAVYKILYVIFEGYFCWKKISKETIKENYGEAINRKQIVKRKGQQEY